jgi:hypothetical protein
MGLTWRDLLGETPVTPEARKRIHDRARLGKLETRHGWLILAKALENNKAYWERQVATIEREIMYLRLSMDEWGPR